MARVIPLAKRRLQYFRCFAVGHTRTNCLSLIDRTSWCFKCGGNDGHKAIGCNLPPRCPVCVSRGLAAGHRAGAPECVLYNGRGQTSADPEASVKEVRETSTGVDRGAPELVDAEPAVMEVCDG